MLDISFDELKERLQDIPQMTISTDIYKKIVDAVNMIIKTKRSSNVVIFTDANDVDGMCGGAIWYITLTQLGFNNIRIYGSLDRTTLPDDICINDEQDDSVVPNGLAYATNDSNRPAIDMVITNDVGINMDWSRCCARQLIITDHHMIDEHKTYQPHDKQIAICIPNICGAMVSAMLSRYMVYGYKVPDEIAELAALATIADCMPINSINQPAIQLLYNHIRSYNVMSKALYFLTKPYVGRFDDDTLKFFVIPKLNAPMRIHNDMRAKGEYLDWNGNKLNWQFVIKYLIKPSQLHVSLFDSINEERKAIVDNYYTKICEKMDDMIHSDAANPTDKHCISRMDDNTSNDVSIRRGQTALEIQIDVDRHITGLIASKLVDKMHMPVVVKGTCGCSIRGPGAMELLKANHDNLEAYGGHKEAAGFKLKTNQQLNINAHIDITPQVNPAYFKWRDDYDHTTIKNWLIDNAPFTSNPLFIKRCVIARTQVFKGLHTRIVDSDGYEFMYFFHVPSCQVNDIVSITFTIGACNKVNNICATDDTTMIEH